MLYQQLRAQAVPGGRAQLRVVKPIGFEDGLLESWHRQDRRGDLRNAEFRVVHEERRLGIFQEACNLGGCQAPIERSKNEPGANCGEMQYQECPRIAGQCCYARPAGRSEFLTQPTRCPINVPIKLCIAPATAGLQIDTGQPVWACSGMRRNGIDHACYGRCIRDLS